MFRFNRWISLLALIASTCSDDFSDIFYRILFDLCYFEQKVLTRLLLRPSLDRLVGRQTQ